MTDRYIITDRSGPDIEFEGDLLVDEAHHDTGRVTTYRTRAGKYVVRQVRSGTGGIEHLDRTGIFDDVGELVDWLGYSPGAKAVLEKLGYQDRKRIE